MSCEWYCSYSNEKYRGRAATDLSVAALECFSFKTVFCSSSIVLLFFFLNLVYLNSHEWSLYLLWCPKSNLNLIFWLLLLPSKGYFRRILLFFDKKIWHKRPQRRKLNLISLFQLCDKYNREEDTSATWRGQCSVPVGALCITAGQQFSQQQSQLYLGWGTYHTRVAGA